MDDFIYRHHRRIRGRGCRRLPFHVYIWQSLNRKHLTLFNVHSLNWPRANENELNLFLDECQKLNNIIGGVDRLDHHSSDGPFSRNLNENGQTTDQLVYGNSCTVHTFMFIYSFVSVGTWMVVSMQSYDVADWQSRLKYLFFVSNRHLKSIMCTSVRDEMGERRRKRSEGGNQVVCKKILVQILQNSDCHQLLPFPFRFFFLFLVQFFLLSFYFVEAASTNHIWRVHRTSTTKICNRISLGLLKKYDHAIIESTYKPNTWERNLFIMGKSNWSRIGELGAVTVMEAGENKMFWCDRFWKRKL